MTRLNHKQNVTVLYPKKVQYVSKPEQPWRTHLFAAMAVTGIVAAAVALIAFIGAVIGALLITGAIALAFVVVTGSIGWLIRRVP